MLQPCADLECQPVARLRTCVSTFHKRFCAQPSWETLPGTSSLASSGFPLGVGKLLPAIALMRHGVSCVCVCVCERLYFFLTFILCWSIAVSNVQLQVDHEGTQPPEHQTPFFPQTPSHPRLPGNRQRSLISTGGPCWLLHLDTTVCKCPSQTPWLSSPTVTHWQSSRSFFKFGVGFCLVNKFICIISFRCYTERISYDFSSSLRQCLLSAVRFLSISWEWNLLYSYEAEMTFSVSLPGKSHGQGNWWACSHVARVELTSGWHYEAENLVTLVWGCLEQPHS